MGEEGGRRRPDNCMGREFALSPQCIVTPSRLWTMVVGSAAQLGRDVHPFWTAGPIVTSSHSLEPVDWRGWYGAQQRTWGRRSGIQLRLTMGDDGV